MGATSSSTDIRSPFGGVPNKIARQILGSQLGPLLRGLGFGGGPNSARFEHRLENATGPLADFIRQVRGFSGDVIGQAQGVGNQVAGQSQLDYNTLRGQIEGSLANLPNYQAAANRGLDLAGSALSDAFSPVRQSALFQRTAQDVQNQLRPGEAARGLETSGGSQQMEQNTLQNLGLQFAQNQGAQQQQALGGYGSALQGAMGANTQGIGIAGQLSPALQNLQSGLSQQYMAPLQGAGGLLSLLSAGQTPGIQLTGATSPQLGTSSKGGGFWGCCDEMTHIETPNGPVMIADLTLGDIVYSRTLDGRIIPAAVIAMTSEMKYQHTYADVAGEFISPNHPLSTGQLVGDVYRGRVTVPRAITWDIRVGSETGYYQSRGVWLGSTIDSRHVSRREAA